MTTSGGAAEGALKGVVVGTGGHVDHGKTTLVRALTGVETDRWKEERERGLTIDIGFARLPLEAELETGVVDVPGHEDFLKNMLAGATGIDILLLVVAADEGPMPQTYEHLAIARLLGVERGVVALTKLDRVDEAWLELVTEATREALAEVLGHERWPIVGVSATEGTGLTELLDALREGARGVPQRNADDFFRMPVDRSFSIHGTGTVVTGTAWSGRVATGAEVRIFPGERRARVRALQVHGDARLEVAAGRRCALALVGVEPDTVGRGSVLVTDEFWRGTARLGARITLLPRPGRSVEHGQRLRVYLGTREVMARVFLPRGGAIAPGDRSWAVLALEEPLVARVRDRFILRFYSPVTTIGGGVVAELEPPRAWRERTPLWARILEGPSSDALVAAIESRRLRGLPVGEAPIATGLSPAAVADAGGRASAITRLGDRWFADSFHEEAVGRVRSTVERLHGDRRRAPAVSLEAVRATVARSCDPALVDDAIRTLAERDEVTVEGPRIALAGQGASLTAAEEAARDRLIELLSAGGLQPPTVSDLRRELRIDRDLLDDLLPLLRDEGRIVSVTPEIHITTEAADSLRLRVEGLLAGGQVVPPVRFKETLGLTRKYLIPMLEYLDREGVTKRTGEGRVRAE